MRGRTVQYTTKRKTIQLHFLKAAFTEHITMKTYMEVQKATAVLQERYRALTEGRTQAVFYQQKRSAALVLQSMYRGYKARRLLNELRTVVKIQSVYRGSVARSQYTTKRKAIVKLQAAFRRYIAMKWYHAVQKATAVLQERCSEPMVQGRRQATLYQKKRSAVLVLQSIYRRIDSQKIR